MGVERRLAPKIGARPPFAPGKPDLTAFPFALWSRLLARMWRRPGAALSATTIRRVTRRCAAPSPRFFAPPWPGESGPPDVALAARLAEGGLICPPLSRYFRRRPGQPGLMLGFARFAQSEIRSGVSLLAEKLRQT
jgi:DNA-binding transcriptional MocR family regulator